MDYLFNAILIYLFFYNAHPLLKASHVSNSQLTYHNSLMLYELEDSIQNSIENNSFLSLYYSLIQKGLNLHGDLE